MAERFLIRDAVVPKDLPVPELTQKKVERNLKLQAEKDAALVERRRTIREVRHALKMRTLKYEKEYRLADRQAIELRRQAKLEGGFFKEPDAKVIFAIRIRGINKLAPKPKKILQLFRLRQLHNGVFIQVNKATIEMLKVIAPFITYGYPSLRTIRQLIYKRGYARVGRMGARQRVKLQHNEIISENLGKYGIHGIEDIVHELYTCGPNFKYVNTFLWPIKLSSPRKGYVAKRHGFNEPCGGDWGNRERRVNELVERMN